MAPANGVDRKPVSEMEGGYVQKRVAAVYVVGFPVLLLNGLLLRGLVGPFGDRMLDIRCLHG
jgi:hypothetical protein